MNTKQVLKQFFNLIFVSSTSADVEVRATKFRFESGSLNLCFITHAHTLSFIHTHTHTHSHTHTQFEVYYSTAADKIHSPVASPPFPWAIMMK